MKDEKIIVKLQRSIRTKNELMSTLKRLVLTNTASNTQDTSIISNTSNSSTIITSNKTSSPIDSDPVDSSYPLLTSLDPPHQFHCVNSDSDSDHYRLQQTSSNITPIVNSTSVQIHQPKPNNDSANETIASSSSDEQYQQFNDEFISAYEQKSYEIG